MRLQRCLVAWYRSVTVEISIVIAQYGLVSLDMGPKLWYCPVASNPRVVRFSDRYIPLVLGNTFLFYSVRYDADERCLLEDFSSQRRILKRRY
ncbi:hypothetical protein BHM03_00034768 [Ensete ventricosum]|nr:hypothetical protein BHM03_00034768 [Ensete ventricosum]